MLAQTLIVGVLVPGCALYSTWTLMPAGARRRVAQRLLKVKLPKAVQARLLRHAQAAGGCGCDGCDQGSKATGSAAAKPIHFQRRLPR
jgi:hypothetical protein